MIKDIYKKNKKILTILYLICLLCVVMLCYTHAKPTKDERVFIFVTGQKYMKEDVKNDLEVLGEEFGIVDVSSFGYDEYDSSFSQAFATKGYYSSDIYIMSKDVFEKYKDSGSFAFLSSNIISLNDNYIKDSSGNIIAIYLNDEYYIAIGRKTNKPTELSEILVKYIVSNGDDLFE